MTVTITEAIMQTVSVTITPVATKAVTATVNIDSHRARLLGKSPCWPGSRRQEAFSGMHCKQQCLIAYAASQFGHLQRL